jgi:hypothetical protein
MLVLALVPVVMVAILIALMSRTMPAINTVLVEGHQLHELDSPAPVGGVQTPGWWTSARSRTGARLIDASLVCRVMCGGSHMATNLGIDPHLLELALEVSGEKTKKAAVTRALTEFIARRQQRRLRELFGQLDWDPDFDYKAERSR